MGTSWNPARTRTPRQPGCNLHRLPPWGCGGDRQYRAILSFNTGGLPDNAVITRVTLKIKKQGLLGTNPFTILGRLKADIRKPYFSATPWLVTTDFQAAADKVMVGTFTMNPWNNWYIGVIESAGYPYINKTGATQFRLRFYKDDNDDGTRIT